MTQCPVKEAAMFFFLPEDVYLNIFEDTTDPLERRILAQRIIDVIALRPRLDLQDGVWDVGEDALTAKGGNKTLQRWAYLKVGKIAYLYFHEPKPIYLREFGSTCISHDIAKLLTWLFYQKQVFVFKSGQYTWWMLKGKQKRIRGKWRMRKALKLLAIMIPESRSVR